MADQKISQLDIATSSLADDNLVIQRGFDNLSLAVGLISTGGGDTGSFVTTSSISGTTQTFTKGDGSTYTNEIVSASFAVSASYAVSSSVEITKEVSSSYADTASYFDTDPISASLTTTDQTISSSVASLSGSASDARNQLAADYIAADTALSASLTTTDQNISSSVASLSGSASDARNQLATDYIAADTALSASLTTTDQNISASVATLSGSASDARNQLKTDLTVAGTDGQTIRYEGTTQVANSVLFNSGSQVSIGNTSPKAGYSLSVANQDNAFDHRMLVGSPTVGGTQDYLELRSTGTTGYLEARNDLMISASHDGNTADITVRTNRNIILSASNGAVYNASKQIKDLADPTAAQDAATKNYVDTSTANSNYVAVTGDTMTGKLVADQGASSDEGINIEANSGVEPALGFLQKTVAQSFLVSEQASPYALRYTSGDKTSLRNIKAADPVDSDDLATKNYVDGLLTSTIAAAVWDSSATAQTQNGATKITFNLNSSRQTSTNDSSQASWNTTNNEFVLGEGTWHIVFDYRKDTNVGSPTSDTRFFQMRSNTTAGGSVNSGTLIDAAPTKFNDSSGEKIHMEAFLTVPASSTRYVFFANVTSGVNTTGRFQKAICRRIE